MKPELSQVLVMSGMQLPGVAAATSYAQGSAGLITGLMMMAAEEHDRAAEVRVAENARMRALFKSLGAKVKDAALRGELETAATSKDPGLRISALNTANADLRKLLIALQTAMEDAADRDAQKQIWAHLQKTSEERMLKLG